MTITDEQRAEAGRRYSEIERELAARPQGPVIHQERTRHAKPAFNQEHCDGCHGLFGRGTLRVTEGGQKVLCEGCWKKR